MVCKMDKLNILIEQYGLGTIEERTLGTVPSVHLSAEGGT